MERPFSILCYADTTIKAPKMIYHQNDTNVCKMIFTCYASTGVIMDDIINAVVTVTRPDLTESSYSGVAQGITIANNVITFILPPAAINQSGQWLGEFYLYGSNNKQITMSTFKYMVLDQMLNFTTVPNDTQYPVLVTLINTITDVQGTLTGNEVIRQSNENERILNRAAVALAESLRVTAESLRQTYVATMVTATNNANNSHGKDGFSSIVESQFVATVANTTHITTHFNDFNPLSDDLQVNGGKYNSDLTKNLEYTENPDNLSIDLNGWSINVGDVVNFKLYKHIDEGNISTNITGLINATASGLSTKSALDLSIANGQIGNVTSLTTQNKTNLVNAINENVTSLATIVQEIGRAHV